MNERTHLYDGIGGSYGVARREDRRIAAEIRAAVGNAQSVINVGAGTGNYEPPDLTVVACVLRRSTSPWLFSQCTIGRIARPGSPSSAASHTAR
jgi:hypothetical protein